MLKEKIVEIRQKNKLTQAEFGEVLKIAQFTISRIERGQQEVDLKMLIGLSEHFDVNIQELITGKKTDAPDNTRITELETENRLMRELLNLNVSEKKVG